MKYQITFISKTDPLKEKDNPVNKQIEAVGAKVLDSKSLGEKQFAYKINKETAGYYTTIDFESDPAKIIELNKKLALTNEVIRFLILHQKKEMVDAPKIAQKPISPESLPAPEIEKPAEKDIVPEPVVQPVAETETKVEAEPEKVAGVVSQKEETPKEEKTIKTAVKEKVTAKPSPAEKTETKKPVKSTTTKISEEAISTEERLKALDKKLDELLKE